MNQTTNTTASIDLAQLDKTERLAKMFRDITAFHPGHFHQLMSFANSALEVCALARRSLTSAAPTEPKAWIADGQLFANHDCIPPRLLPPLGNPVPLYAAPVHGAAAPSAEQAPMEYRTCCDHPDCTTCAGRGGFYRLPASAAGAGSDQAPAGEVKIGTHGKLIDWNQNGPDLFDLPAGTKIYLAAPSVTVQDERALPPLPNSVDVVRCTFRGQLELVEANDEYFTAGQMRAYAREAIRNETTGLIYAASGIEGIADELEADALNYEGDFADTVKGCVEALRDLVAHAAHPVQDGEKDAQTQAARDVLAERRRQVEQEGWTPGHDDAYVKYELIRAAACYALSDAIWVNDKPVWPWSMDWWKPCAGRRDLIKAGALILAEVERMDRAEAAQQDAKGE